MDNSETGAAFVCAVGSMSTDDRFSGASAANLAVQSNWSLRAVRRHSVSGIQSGADHVVVR